MKPAIFVHSRLAGWVMPPTTRAFTFGRRIYCRPGVRLTEGDIAHELTHVRQYREFGILGFTVRYLFYTLKFGYRDNPLEVQARSIAEQVAADLAHPSAMTNIEVVAL